MFRPRSGDSGYYSRPPPAIVRSSASPEPVAARAGDSSNPFAAYRSFEQFRSNKQGAATSRQQDRLYSIVLYSVLA